jgi:hypothetical protein
MRQALLRRAAPASMFNATQIATSPEASCRAGRPCLGGSKSRNRVSELLAWPGLFFERSETAYGPNGCIEKT